VQLVDDFLTPRALLSFQRYFINFASWNVNRYTEHAKPCTNFLIFSRLGYLGAYSDWGLDAPILFQLAEELHFVRSVLHALCMVMTATAQLCNGTDLTPGVLSSQVNASMGVQIRRRAQVRTC
jgi:hypothetical protein